jgi:hypothetical protein
MNDKQRKLIPLILALFLLSVVYVPGIIIFEGNEFPYGWDFIWDVSNGIHLKTLFAEWIFIGIFGGGLFLYYK